MKGHLFLKICCTVWTWAQKSQTCTVPAQVSALHQTSCLSHKKDESCFSCEVMKLGAECCVWSCPAACFVKAGSPTQKVTLTAQPLYSTSDANTGTLSCFDPRVSWITHRSVQSCGYEAQCCTWFSQSEQSVCKKAVLLDFLELLYHDFIVFTSSQLWSHIVG